MKKLYAMLALLLAVAPASADPIDDAVAAASRTEANVARDRYRHPAETLRFFQVEPDMTVVEIWPGGGWYTEILAPLLAEKGKLFVALYSDTAEGLPAYQPRLNKAMRDRFKADPAVYGKVEITHLHLPDETQVAPEGSADRVLTFRNVHNWLADDQAEDAFRAFFKALKPGGLLGVVEHRAKPGTDLETMKNSGYVTEEKVKELAKQAGFEFVAASEINANPKDDANHPRGVWTLPPTLALGEQNRERYLAIGESDRMTLLFRKPE